MSCSRKKINTLTLLTCDNQTVVIIQCFREEAGNDEFRVDQKSDFFLNETRTGDSSSNKLVCEIHLWIKSVNKEKGTEHHALANSIKLERLRNPEWAATESRCTLLSWVNDACDLFCCLCPSWPVCKSLGKFSTSYFCFNLIIVSKKWQHFIIPEPDWQLTVCQDAVTWNIRAQSNFRSDGCCSLACRAPKRTHGNPKGSSCRGTSCSRRAILPKEVTQLWGSKPATKLCFDRLSAPSPSQ